MSNVARVCRQPAADLTLAPESTNMKLLACCDRVEMNQHIRVIRGSFKCCWHPVAACGLIHLATELDQNYRELHHAPRLVHRLDRVVCVCLLPYRRCRGDQMGADQDRR